MESLGGNNIKPRLSTVRWTTQMYWSAPLFSCEVTTFIFIEIAIA